MAKRKNTLTRFIEDIVDDTKDFVDDLLDRAKDFEEDTKDAITDVVDDDERGSASSADVASLKASLAALQAKVEELTVLQAKGAKA
jgi:polyhydroxyalkanoate synthesis regulator phasin